MFFITKKQSFFCIQINIAADEFRASHSLYRKSASWICFALKALRLSHCVLVGFGFSLTGLHFVSSVRKSAVLNFFHAHGVPTSCLRHCRCHPFIGLFGCASLVFRYKLHCNFSLKSTLQLTGSLTSFDSTLPKILRYPAFSRTEIRLKRLAECEYRECCIKNFEQYLFYVLFCAGKSGLAAEG